MFLKEDTNLSEFIKNVNSCKGEIYFETEEGDSLALKSVLCQFIFCTLFERPDILYRGTVRIERYEDETVLQQFLR